MSPWHGLGRTHGNLDDSLHRAPRVEIEQVSWKSEVIQPEAGN